MAKTTSKANPREPTWTDVTAVNDWHIASLIAAGVVPQDYQPRPEAMSPKSPPDGEAPKIVEPAAPKSTPPSTSEPPKQK